MSPFGAGSSSSSSSSSKGHHGRKDDVALDSGMSVFALTHIIVAPVLFLSTCYSFSHIFSFSCMTRSPFHFSLLFFFFFFFFFSYCIFSPATFYYYSSSSSTSPSSTSPAQTRRRCAPSNVRWTRYWHRSHAPAACPRANCACPPIVPLYSVALHPPPLPLPLPRPPPHHHQQQQRLRRQSQWWAVRRVRPIARASIATRLR